MRSRPDSSRSRRQGSRRTAGLSLVELLVAFIILLLGLALAAEIGVRARSMLAHSARDARRPPIGAVLGRLRTDVAGAERFDPPLSPDPLTGWTLEPLILRLSRGALLYRSAGATVERIAFDAEGKPIGRLTLVRDGGSWRWRSIDTHLVEVSIAYLAEPGAPGAAGRAIRREELRLALRGAPGRFGW